MCQRTSRYLQRDGKKMSADYIDDINKTARIVTDTLPRLYFVAFFPLLFLTSSSFLFIFCTVYHTVLRRVNYFSISCANHRFISIPDRFYSNSSFMGTRAEDAYAFFFRFFSERVQLFICLICVERLTSRSSVTVRRTEEEEKKNERLMRKVVLCNSKWIKTMTCYSFINKKLSVFHFGKCCKETLISHCSLFSLYITTRILLRIQNVKNTVITSLLLSPQVPRVYENKGKTYVLLNCFFPHQHGRENDSESYCYI